MQSFVKTSRVVDGAAPETSPRPNQLGETLADAEYLRRRAHPSVFDVEYVHLSDLGQLLKRFESQFHGDVFDYGCGGAPYREMFAHCHRYVKADVTPGPLVDRVLKQDGRTEEADNTYDWVISTQVLEHVRYPAEYVRECRRILRPGGRLLVTTHGMIEEHGCPYDFTRWTARGLEDLVATGGLTVIENGKLSTEVRAFCQLMHQLLMHLRADGRPLLHYSLAIVRRLYFAVGMPVLNTFARMFPSQAIAPATSPASLYTGVYVVAQKPTTPP